MLVYPVGVPVCMAMVLYKARDQIRGGDPTTLVTSTQFLHHDYRQEFFWWEALEAVRKLLLTGFAALIRPGSEIQLMAGIALAACGWMAVQAARPYKNEAVNSLARATQGMLTITLFCCLGLKHYSRMDEAALASEPLSMEGLSLLLLVANLLVLVFVLSTFIWQSRQSARLPLIRLPSGSPVEMQHIREGEKWHIFLSHVWLSGQDQMGTVKAQLSTLVPGMKLFLDVDDLTAISDLEPLIRQSGTILFFLSAGYFKSWNCLREVRESLKQKKPIVLLMEMDKRHGGLELEELKAECPEDLVDQIFTPDRVILQWHRIHDFRLVTLKLIVEDLHMFQQMGEVQQQEAAEQDPAEDVQMQPLPLDEGKKGNPTASPTRSSLQSLGKLLRTSRGPQQLPERVRLHMSGELELQKVELSPPKAPAVAHVATSAHNPGVDRIVGLLQAELPNLLSVGGVVGEVDPKRTEWLMLYLNKDTWTSQVADKLGEQMRAAIKAGARLCLLHECDPKHGHIEFDQVIRETPKDLFKEYGIYGSLAITLLAAPYHTVSIKNLALKVTKGARRRTAPQRLISSITAAFKNATLLGANLSAGYKIERITTGKEACPSSTKPSDNEEHDEEKM